MRTSLILAAAVATGVSVGLAAQAGAADLKLSHSHQPSMTSEIQTAAWVFRNYVNENAKDLTVRIYAANALGEERAVYEAMQLGGGASCAITGSTILTNFAPKLGVLDLPFLWQNYNHIHEVFDGEVGEQLNAEIEAIGLVPLAWMDSWGWRNVVTSKKEVTSPEDLQGLKIRTIQSPVYVAALQSMGANATPMAFGEVYTGMQTGVLDGFEHGSAVIVAQKFYEVSDYVARTEHLISPLVFACSRSEWETWSEADREVVREAAKLAQDINRALAPMREAEAFAFLKEQGMTINDIDTSGFREAAVGVQDEVAAEIGAIELLEQIRTAIE